MVGGIPWELVIEVALQMRAATELGFLGLIRARGVLCGLGCW